MNKNKISIVRPPLKKSYLNNPERNPFRKIWDSDRFRNPTKYSLVGFPLLVDVEPTNHCNLRCTFCATQIMKRQKGFMDFNLYKQIVDEIAKNNAALKFSRWGEPFLHPKIYEMFAYAKEKDLMLHITTNGILFDPYKLKNVDSINFSFHGTKKEEHELITGSDFYDLIVDKIETLLRLKNRPAVGITTTVLDETKEEIADFINKWITKVEQVSYGYTYYGHLDGERVLQFKKRQIWKGRQRPCNNVLVDLGVDWDGYVVACCADYDRLMVLGSLENSTLKELWTCEKMQAYRKLILSGQMDKIALCRTCANRW
ncbi:MAG: radical SAM protein [Candidatus Omnitrophica bacterium]|nr:radical SAM protein [Candidatus Omnitrophota bacterium]